MSSVFGIYLFLGRKTGNNVRGDALTFCQQLGVKFRVLRLKGKDIRARAWPRRILRGAGFFEAGAQRHSIGFCPVQEALS